MTKLFGVHESIQFNLTFFYVFEFQFYFSCNKHYLNSNIRYCSYCGHLHLSMQIVATISHDQKNTNVGGC